MQIISSPYPLNVADVLRSERQCGHQNVVNVLIQPRFLYLISRNSCLQNGQIGHSESLAGMNWIFSAIFLNP